MFDVESQGVGGLQPRLQMTAFACVCGCIAKPVREDGYQRLIRQLPLTGGNASAITLKMPTNEATGNGCHVNNPANAGTSSQYMRISEAKHMQSTQQVGQSQAAWHLRHWRSIACKKCLSRLPAASAILTCQVPTHCQNKTQGQCAVGVSISYLKPARVGEQTYVAWHVHEGICALVSVKCLSMRDIRCVIF